MKAQKDSIDSQTKPYCLTRKQIIEAIPFSNLANHFKPLRLKTDEELSIIYRSYDESLEKPTHKEMKNYPS